MTFLYVKHPADKRLLITGQSGVKQVRVLYKTEVNKQQVSQQTARSSSHSPSGSLGMSTFTKIHMAPNKYS